MEDNGFAVKEIPTDDLDAIKIQYQVPSTVQSCHTAIVDGYIIEGHVPAAEIERLLSERPEIVGLAVIGMPAGSPGMEDGSVTEAVFDVISFDKSGNTAIYASYP